MASMANLAADSLSYWLYVETLGISCDDSVSKRKDQDKPIKADPTKCSAIGLPLTDVTAGICICDGDGATQELCRVLGVKHPTLGTLELCNSNIVVYLSGNFDPAEEFCNRTDLLKIRVPLNLPLPYLLMEWQSSFAHSLNGGVSVSGSVDASVDVSGTRITATLRAKAKVKVLGQTVASYSESISCSKNVTEPNTCVTCKAGAGPFEFSGKLCLEGSKACLRDGKVVVEYKGNDYTIASGIEACVGLAAMSTCCTKSEPPMPTLAPQPCGCGNG